MARATTSTPVLTKNVKVISASTDPVRGNQEIDGVLSGVAWETSTGSYLNGVLTFSFPDEWNDYGKTYGSNEHRKNFRSFTTEQEQTAFYNVLANMGTVLTDNPLIQPGDIQYISAVTTLTFNELGDTGNSTDDKSALLRFGKTDMTSAEAWAYYPSSNATGGDAWFSNQFMNFGNMQIGTYDYTVLLHELGHSLGLKHTFEKTAAGFPPIDSLSYSVMSYASYPGADNWYGGTAYDFPQTLMMYDIAALQHMYGANWKANPGNTVYTWTPNSNLLTIKDGTADPRFFDPAGDKVYQTLWDGAGKDTYNLSAFTLGLTIDLRPGEWVNLNNHQLADIDGAGVGYNRLAPGNVANALTVKTYDANGNVTGENLGSLIENAVGGRASDTITANRAANELTGGRHSAAGLSGDNFIWKDLGSLVNSTSAGSKTGWDSILDFQVGIDEIDVSALTIINESKSYIKDGHLVLVDDALKEVARINVTSDVAYSSSTWDTWFA